jgi:hypothetical protein
MFVEEMRTRACDKDNNYLTVSVPATLVIRRESGRSLSFRDRRTTEGEKKSSTLRSSFLRVLPRSILTAPA